MSNLSRKRFEDSQSVSFSARHVGNLHTNLQWTIPVRVGILTGNHAASPRSTSRSSRPRGRNTRALDIPRAPGPAASRHAFLPVREPSLPARSRSASFPGRIEVFGRHTDYAGGRSLVCAIDNGFLFAAAAGQRQARAADGGLRGVRRRGVRSRSLPGADRRTVGQLPHEHGPASFEELSRQRSAAWTSPFPPRCPLEAG